MIIYAIVKTDVAHFQDIRISIEKYFLSKEKAEAEVNAPRQPGDYASYHVKPLEVEE